MSKKLTLKEQLFVKHYVKTRNATESAKLAGYSEDTAGVIGSENLKKPYIQDAVNKQIRMIEEKVDISTEMIISELKKVAMANITEIASWKDGSVSFTPSEDLDEDATASIQEVSSQATEFGQNMKVKLYDKIRALELLGKHLKMFSEKVEVSGPDGKPIEIQSFVDIIKMGLKK